MQISAARPASLRSGLFYAYRWRGLAAVVATALLAFVFALVVVAWPLPGMAVPLALSAIALFVRQPQWIMLTFFFSLAIPIQSSIAGLSLNAADGLLVGWCCLWPLMMARKDAPPAARWRVPSLVMFISPFIVVAVLSQLGSINASASSKQLLRIVEWFVILPLLLTALVPRAHFRKFCGLMLMLVPCIFSLDGLYEYLNDGQTLTGILGISVPVPEGMSAQIRHTFDVSGRAGSSFGGAQGLAMYLAMTMSFSIAHVIYAPERWIRNLAFFCLVISAVGLGVAQSRGGLIGVLAMMLAMLLVAAPTFRLPVFMLTGLGLAVGVSALGVWPFWDGTVAGLVPGRPEAVLDRLIIWGVVRDVFFEYPFFGVGLGNFRDAFFAQEPWLHVDLAYPSLHAHNTYLELLADTGGVGLLAYVTFLALTARRLFRIWTESSRPLFTLAALGSLSAYAVFAMVDMLLLQNMHFLLVLVLSIGLSEDDSPVVGAAAKRDGAQ